MAGLATGLMAGLAAGPLASPAAAQIPDTFTNLQHFPEDISRDSLIGNMRDFSFALGVRCTYCHEGEDSMRFSDVDFASDARATKRRARYMLRMVDRINGELLADLPPAGGEDGGGEEMPDRDAAGREPSGGDPGGGDAAETQAGRSRVRVECATCHRGYPRPIMIEDSLRAVLAAEGAEAAARTYRDLWDRYYGDWTFDFGVWVMNDLTRSLAEAGKLDAAVALQRVNVEKHPEGASALFPLAELLRMRGDEGDREAAVEAYRKVLTASPDHRGARRGLEALGVEPRPRR